ncbi:hypothetical protein GWK47_040114 [Chionoecetes opilio]|uniref:Uncharacterized protein n=1 Tax=Chionoecetes opilio TaxID=41210 RepID=A0A8J4YJV6_CHIOP|nr:hypothetical protein GWK47_040114 [Chionoecetes opilio]
MKPRRGGSPGLLSLPTDVVMIFPKTPALRKLHHRRSEYTWRPSKKEHRPGRDPLVSQNSRGVSRQEKVTSRLSRRPRELNLQRLLSIPGPKKAPATFAASIARGRDIVPPPSNSQPTYGDPPKTNPDKNLRFITGDSDKLTTWITKGGKAVIPSARECSSVPGYKHSTHESHKTPSQFNDPWGLLLKDTGPNFPRMEHPATRQM